MPARQGARSPKATPDKPNGPQASKMTSTGSRLPVQPREPLKRLIREPITALTLTVVVLLSLSSAYQLYEGWDEQNRGPSEKHLAVAVQGPAIESGQAGRVEAVPPPLPLSNKRALAGSDNAGAWLGASIQEQDALAENMAITLMPIKRGINGVYLRACIDRTVRGGGIDITLARVGALCASMF